MGDIMLVCVVLHNFLLMNGDELQYSELDDVSDATPASLDADEVQNINASIRNVLS